MAYELTLCLALEVDIRGVPIVVQSVSSSREGHAIPAQPLKLGRRNLSLSWEFLRGKGTYPFNNHSFAA
jgi:hypothetical protein